MNHDYAHCFDYTSSCPKTCFRGELVRDLKKRPDLWDIHFTYASFKYTKECPKWPKKENNHGK